MGVEVGAVAGALLFCANPATALNTTANMAIRLRNVIIRFLSERGTRLKKRLENSNGQILRVGGRRVSPFLFFGLCFTLLRAGHASHQLVESLFGGHLF